MRNFILLFFILSVNYIYAEKDINKKIVYSEARSDKTYYCKRTEKVKIGEDRAYKNWRLGFGFYNIPKDFEITICEQIFDTPIDSDAIVVRIYKNGKYIIRFFIRKYFDVIEEDKSDCYLRSSDLFTPNVNKIIVDCSYHVEQKPNKEFPRENTIAFSNVRKEAYDWYNKNFKIFGLKIKEKSLKILEKEDEDSEIDLKKRFETILIEEDREEDTKELKESRKKFKKYLKEKKNLKKFDKEGKELLKEYMKHDLKLYE